MTDHERIAELERRVMDYESAEASVCPEDVGVVEYIGVLRKRLAEREAENARLREALKYLSLYANTYPCSCRERFILDDTGTLPSGIIRCNRCYGLRLAREADRG